MSTKTKTARVLLTAQIVFCGLVFFGPVIDPLIIQILWTPPIWIKGIFGFIFVVSLMLFVFALFNLGRSLTPSPIPKESSALVRASSELVAQLREKMQKII